MTSTDTDTDTTSTDMGTARKPRLAIMGEFSSGKSTLTNLFLGQRPLPEKVTATRLSPVWISKGTDAPYRQRLDGVQEPITLELLGQVPVEDTHSIRMFFEADVLELCDIIDIPGISDPNMDAEVWQRMIPDVDVVLWCTHATQAWRQSEAAAWATIPKDIAQTVIPTDDGWPRSVFTITTTTEASATTTTEAKANVTPEARTTTTKAMASATAIKGNTTTTTTTSDSTVRQCAC